MGDGCRRNNEKRKRLIPGTDQNRKVTVIVLKNVGLTAQLTSNRSPVFAPVNCQTRFQSLYISHAPLLRYTGKSNTRQRNIDPHASELPQFVHPDLNQMPDPHRRRRRMQSFAHNSPSEKTNIRLCYISSADYVSCVGSRTT